MCCCLAMRGLQGERSCRALVRPFLDNAHDLVWVRGFAARPVAASGLRGFEFPGKFPEQLAFALTAGMSADD